MRKIVVVGGGMTGLSAAHALECARLRGAPVDFLLLEKAGRLGGCIVTEKAEGFVIEGGPDCFVSEKPWPIELSRTLGIEEHLVCTNEENKGTYVLSGGTLHRLPEGLIAMVPSQFWPFVTSRLISWPGKLRMGLEYFVPPKTDGADETLASFVRRRVGQEVLEKVADPLIAGIHASDPESMSLRSTFPRFLEMEGKYGSLTRAMLSARRSARRKAKETGSPAVRSFFMSFGDGMQELVDHLAVSLSGRVRLGADVSRLMERVGREPRYEIELNDGERIEADVVIVTTPAFAAADLVGEIDGLLARRLREIPYVSSATISLAYKAEDVGRALNGFGFVVPHNERRTIMAMTWSSSKWPGRAPDGMVLLRAFVGGAKDEGYAALGDATLTGAVGEDLRDIMGITAEPILMRIFRWPKAMPQYTLGHLDRVNEIENRAAAHPGLHLAGAAYRGVGIGDCIREGRAAAEGALALLRPMHD